MTSALFASCTRQGTDPLISAGGEFVAGVAFLTFFATEVRFGVAQRISGPRRGPYTYIAFGSAF